MTAYYLVKGMTNNSDTNFQFIIDEDTIDGKKGFSTRLFKITVKEDIAENSIIEENITDRELLHILENQDSLAICFSNLKKYLNAHNIILEDKRFINNYPSSEIEIEFINFINNNF